jgi:outer membrane lipoprotein SlyB
MKNLNFNKIYSQTGIVLCCVAGAIVGYMTGGVYWAVLGIVAGATGGYLLEKKVSRA